MLVALGTGICLLGTLLIPLLGPGFLLLALGVPLLVLGGLLLSQER